MADYLRVDDKGTSVKSLGIIREATDTDAGIFDFIYRQGDYSVFDWGTMPMPEGTQMDNRPVAVVGAYNYELIRKLGFPVSYLGTVADDGAAYNLEQFQDMKLEIRGSKNRQRVTARIFSQAWHKNTERRRSCCFLPRQYRPFSKSRQGNAEINRVRP